MLEKDTEKQVCDWVEADGGVALKIKIESQRGFPDRLIILSDMVLFVEFKVFGGIVSPQQAKWIDILTRLGQKVFVCQSLEFFIGFVEGVRDRPAP